MPAVLSKDTPWVIHDTAKSVRDGLVPFYGPPGSIPMGFYSREDAETYLRTCHKAEDAAKFEVVNIYELPQRGSERVGT